DNADPLVAEDGTRAHAAEAAAHQVQIGTADGRDAQAHYRIGRGLQNRIGHLLETDVADAVEHHCFHAIPSRSRALGATGPQRLSRIPTGGTRLGSAFSPSSRNSRTARTVSRNSLSRACCSPSRSSGRLVSSRHSQSLPPVTSGRQKLTTSWCALSSSSRVVSSLRRRIPEDWARPSSSMPRQRACGSSHCSSLMGSPEGESQVTSLTSSSSLYSPTRNRPRRNIGYWWRRLIR